MSQVSRRLLLAGAGVVAAGSAAGRLLPVARAQDAAAPREEGGICLSMLFENGAKAKFDKGRYVTRHLPLLREVYGDSVERIELRTPPEGSRGMPPALLATTTLWIRDVAAFSQKLGAHAARINKDLDGLARGNRFAQPDRILLGLGEARGEMPSDGEVFSLYYRASPAAPAFDAAFFTGTYLPKLYALYGSKALRRLEASVGMDQGGQKAAQVATYHLYIRDRAAFDAASRDVFTELQQEAGKLMPYMPVFADLRVTAIA